MPRKSIVTLLVSIWFAASPFAHSHDSALTAALDNLLKQELILHVPLESIKIPFFTATKAEIRFKPSLNQATYRYEKGVHCFYSTIRGLLFVEVGNLFAQISGRAEVSLTGKIAIDLKNRTVRASQAKAVDFTVLSMNSSSFLLDAALSQWTGWFSRYKQWYLDLANRDFITEPVLQNLAIDLTNTAFP